MTSVLVQTRRDGSTMTLAQSKRASDLQTDINAWEENRLFRSGVVRLKEVRPCIQACAFSAGLALTLGALWERSLLQGGCAVWRSTMTQQSCAQLACKQSMG